MLVMKKKLHLTPGNRKKSQANIGYENNRKSTDEDDREQARMKTTETGYNEGPKEDINDTAGLRSESGKKTLGKESGNKKS